MEGQERLELEERTRVISRTQDAEVQRIASNRQSTTNARMLAGVLFVVFLALLLLLYFALLVTAPGAILTAVFSDFLGIQPTLVESWIASASISAALFLALYAVVRSRDTTQAIYLVICSVAAIAYVAAGLFQMPWVGKHLSYFVGGQNLSLFGLQNKSSTLVPDFGKATNNSQTAQGSETAAPTKSALPNSTVSLDKPTIENTEAAEASPALPVAVPSTYAWTPSFDCHKISTGQERLICGSKALSAADVHLNQIYRTVLLESKDQISFVASQQSWVENERNACSDPRCMLSAYERRIAQLESRTALVLPRQTISTASEAAPPATNPTMPSSEVASLSESTARYVALEKEINVVWNSLPKAVRDENMVPQRKFNTEKETVCFKEADAAGTGDKFEIARSKCWSRFYSQRIPQLKGFLRP